MFWDITPCSPLKVNRRFEGTCCLYLQDSKDKPRKKLAWKQMTSRATWRRHVPPKRRITRRYIPEDFLLFHNLLIHTKKVIYFLQFNVREQLCQLVLIASSRTAFWVPDFFFPLGQLAVPNLSCFLIRSAHYMGALLLERIKKKRRLKALCNYYNLSYN
jgi:hypothetical protein